MDSNATGLCAARLYRGNSQPRNTQLDGLTANGLRPDSTDCCAS